MYDIKGKYYALKQNNIKKKKEELRDVKQAYASIERIQSKYDKCEDDEVIECEE